MDGYPDVDDQDFQFLIARRLEYVNLENVDGLYPHQEFVRRFMSPYTPYRSLIMFHSLGSGKSIACIAVAVDHYLYDGKRCIIVTKGDSGTDNFTKQISMYRHMSRSSKKHEWSTSIFSMRHYISLSNQIGNMSDDDIIQEFSNSILVLDEVHNVRYLKKATENSVYGSIIRLLKLCQNVKVIIATATPMTDSPEQIHSLLGICNHSRVPRNHYTEKSWLMNGIISYNSTICDRPSSTQIGTKEYIPGMRVYTSSMKGHQERAYSKEHKVKPPDDIYRKLTHISLFCFEDGTYGKEVTDTKMSRTRMKTTITSMSTKQTKEIKYLKYSILPEFADTLVGSSLRNSSSKYSEVVNLIDQSDGNVFIFLEEVKGSGLLLLASVLEQHGYELYLGENMENMSPGMRYTMCVGSSEICPNNSDRLDGFNSDINRNGDYVRILLGSKVIGESITLKNVRQFYCLTPHWNDSTVDQAIGRVVRNGSHSALDERQRSVDIYIHASIYPGDPHNSVDIKKLARCKEKEKSITIVEQMMVDFAVDKYIRDPSVPVTYVVNFAAAYMHHHEERILHFVSEYFENKTHADIHAVAEYLNMNMTVCKEALCKIILSNASLGDFSTRGEKSKKFLRAYGDTVFVADDPSLPFVMVPLAGSYALEPHVHARSYKTIRQSRATYRESAHMSLEEFRYTPVKQKVAYVESCIASGRHDLMSDMQTVYANIGDNIYHLLLYRDLESSYTSSSPVPKKPSGKTRMFSGGEWSTVSAVDEARIFVEYRSMVSDLLAEYDRLYPVYGLISTIDGDMRLRLRDMEDQEKSKSDSRYVRRGKSIRSIRKEILLKILSHITGEEVHASTSINEAAAKIDDLITAAGLYVVL